LATAGVITPAARAKGMSRRAASFTQSDVARALRAAEQVAPGRMAVEIAADGTIRIRPLAQAPGLLPEADAHMPLAEKKEIVL
jgi:hypothetical protein